MRILTHFFLLVTSVSLSAGELQLTLPPVVYAVPGLSVSLYHDNLVLTQTPEQYRFEFACKVGKNEGRRWTVTPADADVGNHPLQVTVKDAGGKVLEQGKTTLHVSSRNAGTGKPLRVLIVGDSLTHASVYPNEIARLGAEPGSPQLTLLGTHKPPSAKPGVAHEGYGGWTWVRFLTQFTPQKSEAAGPLAKKDTSPFIFPSADGGKGVFDLQRYFKEHCDNQPPDVVTFLLGINDCFGANPEDPDAKITEVLANAEKLLAAFHQAAPKARLAVGLTTPPNARQEGFTANYKDKYPRWGWKRIQHRLVKRMLEQFSNREEDGLYLVSTELNLDPMDGYPANNGVHPNQMGYAQIGVSFYCWLKAQY